MSEKFKLTEEQQALLKEKMGVSDLSKVKISFQVNSAHTDRITEQSTNSATSLSFVTCPCKDDFGNYTGEYSWECCFDD